MASPKRSRKNPDLLTVNALLNEALDAFPAIACHPRKALIAYLVGYKEIVAEFGLIVKTTDWLTRTRATKRVIQGMVHHRFPAATLEQMVRDILDATGVLPEDMAALTLTEATLDASLSPANQARL